MIFNGLDEVEYVSKTWMELGSGVPGVEGTGAIIY